MLRFVKVFIVALFLLIMNGCADVTKTNSQEMKRAVAEVAIGKVLVARGAEYNGLPPSGRVGFGPLGFTYHSDGEQIEVSALIAEFSAWTLFPDRQPNLEKTVAALSDPAIGGMFETDGALWKFDRDTGKLYLAYLLPADSDEDELAAAADRLERLHPAWSLRWLGAVGDIVHIGEPKPVQAVTLKDDPYR